MNIRSYTPEKTRRNNLHFKLFYICLVVFIGGALLFTPFVSAYGGLIPFQSISVYEPGQKAIIAWDGQDETMILSIDVNSTDETKALHIIPFPSLPEIKVGDVSSYENIEDIITSKHYRKYSYFIDPPWCGNDALYIEDLEIILNQRIGSHDITVVEINSSQRFMEWVNDFIKNEGFDEKILPKDFEQVVEHYIHQQIRYFVFDVIDLRKDVRSTEPIIFSFKSEYLYYPLKISSLIEGNTKLTLAFLTPRDLPISMVPMGNLGFLKYFDMMITQDECSDIHNDISNMLPDGARLSYFSQQFQLKNLNEDIRLEPMIGIGWMLMQNGISKIGVEDTDLDGKEDIIFRDKDRIYILGEDNLWPFYEFSEGNQYYTSHYYYHHYDLNLDGINETIFKTGKGIIVLNSIDGTVFWERTDLPYPAFMIGDIDSDGKPEIGLVSQGNIYILEGDSGETQWSFIDDVDFTFYNILEDLDLDGKNELIAISKTNIRILNSEDGSTIWDNELEEAYWYDYPELYDFDNDGKLEILIYNRRSSNEVFVLNNENGSLLWEFKISGRYMDDPPIIKDFNNDGKYEILIYSDYRPINITMVNGENGSILWKSSVKHDGRGIDTPILNDIDSDGKIEIIVYNESMISVINSENGSLLWELSDYGSRYYRIRSIEDIDNDGDKEVIITYSNTTLVLNGKDGTQKWNYSIPDPSSIRSFFLENIDSDTNSEIILVYNGGIMVLDGENGIVMWDYFDNYSSWRLTYETTFNDLDHDGNLEIILKARNKIHVLDSQNGEMLLNFTPGEAIYNFELLDKNSDGIKDIVVFTGNKIYIVNFPKSQYKKNIIVIPPTPISQDVTEDIPHELSYVVNGIVLFTFIMVLSGIIYNVKNRRILR
jgi:outer membrane protein assembly factor BamB